MNRPGGEPSDPGLLSGWTRLPALYILRHMKAFLIELDPETAAQLEKVAPGRSRRRSEFIRAAIRRALWELEERATQAAYNRQPDSAEDVYVDPAVWEPRVRRRPRGRRRR